MPPESPSPSLHWELVAVILLAVGALFIDFDTHAIIHGSHNDQAQEVWLLNRLLPALLVLAITLGIHLFRRMGAYQREVAQRQAVELELRTYQTQLGKLVTARTQELIASNDKLRHEIAQRRHAEAQLQHRLAVESTLAAVSQRLFVEETPAMAEIMDALASTVRARRAHLFRFQEGLPLPATAPASHLQCLHGADFPWWVAQLSHGEAIRIANVASLPDEAAAERAFLQHLGMSSLLAVPLRGTCGTLLGFMGFDDSDRQSPWPGEDVQLLAMAAAMLVRKEEQKQQQEALRRSELYLRTITESLDDALIIIDNKGYIESFNPAAERIFGYHARELIGHKINRLMPEAYQSHHDDYLARYEKSGKARIVGVGATVEGVRKDGSHFPAELSLGVMQIEGRNKYVGVLRDISRRVQAQTESLRSAHLASLGEMAASLAHEINNPINAVINYAQILREDGSSLEKDIAARIGKEGDRIAGIVRSLLSFAREGLGKKELHNPRQLFAEILDFIRAQLNDDGIALTEDIPDGLPLLFVHAQQIQQVFLNLVNNARFALNEKFPQSNERKHLSIHVKIVEHGGSSWLRTRISDQGTGIAAPLLSRVMDPFFTTKPRGTGLGLSISHGIVAAHGGRLVIESLEGEWTHVTMDLPLETTQ